MAEVVRLEGAWRRDGADPVPCRLELGPDALTILPESGARLDLPYRTVAALATSEFAATLTLEGGGSVELLRLGARLTLLVATLRERLTRALLADLLVIPPADPLEVVEAAADGWTGLVHLVPHPWGLVLVPLEPAGPPVSLRRAAIAAVTEERDLGRVTIEGSRGERVELRRLGSHAVRLAALVRGLPEAAAADAAAIVAATLPGLDDATRVRLAGLLVDGRPTSRSALGDAWAAACDAFAATGEVGDSLAALLERAGADAPAWLSVAPLVPGEPDPKAWVMAGLPGGIVALEVVSAGSHATYCFRAEAPGGPAEAEALVTTVSEALVDLRFLREPIALPEARLAAGGTHDYRRTVALLPSVRAARARFVGRLVHDDGWTRSLDDVVTWARSGAAGDWPGRRAQEERIAATPDGESAAPIEQAGTTGD